MKKRQIKFSLIYRDMWQSSGKYVPRVDQLKQIAPVIIEMGCFARIETNGGAFEQVNLLFGENPNIAVREWTKPFNEAGIQTHMLERALNGITMYPVPADVRRLMYRVKKAQGTNIARSFCGLNDHRNLELSIKGAKAAGMISQAALSITYSKIHTVDYYMGIVDKAVEYGTDEICLKDMAGIGRPAMLGQLVKAIKTKYPHMPVQYHGHSGPGFSVASMLEVARAGAEYIDVAMEPLSWGMVHPDVITIQEMLKDAGFAVAEINMKAYMEARRLNQVFIDDFLGLFINPKNRNMSSLMIQSGLPGGMMGSLMADLKGLHDSINFSLKEQGKKQLTEDQLMVQLFEEVETIWPKMGYPPLVTPFSQYVKNVALMNLLQLAKGEERYSMIDENTWNMLLGKSGELPGPLAPEIIELAKKQGREFYTGNPQDGYPDALDKFRKEMDEKGWEHGPDDEELFEFAMHEPQYRDYKSGMAKKRFEEEIEKMKSQQNVSLKTSPSMSEKSAPQRTGYSQDEVGTSVAMAAFLIYTLNSRLIAADQESSAHNVWNSIGYWRNLMKVEISCEGKDNEILINRARGKDYELEVMGKLLHIRIEHAEKGSLDFSLDGKMFLATFSRAEEGVTNVQINNKEFKMSRNDLLDVQLSETGPEDSSASAGNVIHSPIPGKVFKIKVSEGDEVKKGDVVVVVDAMKMENNIKAKKDGKVKKIFVNLNDMVEVNAALVELE
jgi:pyruvate carboxylase subunit B